MLYGGIKIEETQSTIVILDESNKLFIPHDIIVDNTSAAIYGFLTSMQQGGIAPQAICFAINPCQVENSEAFKSFTQLFAQAGYEIRIINIAHKNYTPVVVTKSRGADERTTELAIFLKKHFLEQELFLDQEYRLAFHFYRSKFYWVALVLYSIFLSTYFLRALNFDMLDLWILLCLCCAVIRPAIEDYLCRQLNKDNIPAFVLSRYGIQYCVGKSFFGPYKLKQAAFYPWSSVYKIERNEMLFFRRQTPWDNENTYRLYIRQQPTLTLNFWNIRKEEADELNLLKLYKDIFGD